MGWSIVDEFWRIARFSVVGGLATVTHTGVALAIVAVTGLNPSVAAMVGFAAAFLISYFGHFRFTFGAARPYRDYLFKSFVTALASLLLSTSIVWVATAIFHSDYKPVLLSLVMIVPVCNYLVNRFWVFALPNGNLRAPSELVAPEEGFL